MHRTASRSAATRPTWSGNKHAASARLRRRACRPTASARVPGPWPACRVPRPARPREDGSSFAGGHFDADAAVAEESARLVEHRLAADAKLLPRAIGLATMHREVDEGLACRD